MLSSFIEIDHDTEILESNKKINAIEKNDRIIEETEMVCCRIVNIMERQGV